MSEVLQPVQAYSFRHPTSKADGKHENGKKDDEEPTN